VEMLQKEIQSLCNFSFFEIVKIEPAKKVQSFFRKKCL
jgi:phosphatidylglycerophosphatase A